VTQSRGTSGATAKLIDDEVRRVLAEAYDRATELLRENMDKLHVMANALMKYETIGVPQIDAIMAGKEVPPPADWTEGDGGSPNKPTQPTTPVAPTTTPAAQT